MKLACKIAGTLTVATFALTVMAAPASALVDRNAIIAGNGAGSYSKIVKKTYNVNVTTKYQSASVTNVVVPVAITGLNFTNDNLGLVVVNSQPATNNVTINNTFTNN